ncbi:hypothetical protein HK405_014710, partial [Cladochytrium tenue]
MAYVVEVDSDVSDARRFIEARLFEAGIGRDDVTFRVFPSIPKFSAASFALKYDQDVDFLVENPLVKNMWKAQQVYRPSTAAVVRYGSAGSGRLHRRDDFGVDLINDLTGVSAVRQVYGNTGTNATVALIDNGVYYLHPALGGGFGPGYKVAKGYDFVGDDYGVTGNPQPDNDPLDSCSTDGHGTHLAGL